MLNFLLRTELFSIALKKVLLKGIKGRWIVLVFPPINILYLIILNAFLEPLSCLSSNSTPTWPAPYQDISKASQNRILQCFSIHDLAPSMNTWLSVTGFTCAFVIFTSCRIANDPIAEEGVITYTSLSELVLKVSAITLLLTYALVPTDYTATLRGVFAIFVLSFMTIYNIVIGSCCIRWINVLRTLSFLSTLWLCAVVAFYTSASNSLQLYQLGGNIMIVVVVGWLILWTLYAVLDFYWVRPWEDRCAEESLMENSNEDDLSLSSGRISAGLGPRPFPEIERVPRPSLPMIPRKISVVENSYAVVHVELEERSSTAVRGGRPSPWSSDIH